MPRPTARPTARRSELTEPIAIQRAGRVLETIGSGHVIVVDSWSIERSNVAEIGQGAAIAVSHVTVHALTAGQGFDMTARRVLSADAFAPAGLSLPHRARVAEHCSMA